MHFPAYLNQMTMIKRLTFICLLFFVVGGVNAQTYYYHCYRKYDRNDIPQSVNEYKYITFKGDYLYPSDKDGNAISDYWIGNITYKRLKTENGSSYYALWYSGDMFSPCFYEDLYNKYEVCRRHASNNKYANTFYLVSEDKSIINFLSGSYTYCYEKCDGPKVPAMKQ